MLFLGQSLERVKASQQKMDAFNKFGVNLFLAGACEGLARSRDLDEASTTRILSDSVQIIGFKKEQADSFSQKCDEYLLADPRYMQMYHEGRNAMNAHVSGDAEGAGKLEKAIVEWNKPKQREVTSGPISVMFTDMVGSTELTQTRGDAVAQQIVRTHNRIVRDALSKYAGKEIKHTGDGIMASFPTTSNAVESAIFMQRETGAHNAANPELPLNIKIGINAGEPIAEDDDLFGTTVQLAARIVDKAVQGEVLVSEIVRGICAGKELRFANRGEFEMKGFAEPVTLYQVEWGDGATATAAATAEAQDAGGVEAPAAAPEPAPQTSETAAPAPQTAGTAAPAPQTAETAAPAPQTSGTAAPAAQTAESAGAGATSPAPGGPAPETRAQGAAETASD